MRRFFWLVVLLLFVGSVLFLIRTPYQPRQEIALAERFVSLLATGKYEDAYSLVDSRSDAGHNFEEFKVLVQKEWGSDICVPSEIHLRTRMVRPIQSYGNYIGRMLRGREDKPQEISIDFFIASDRAHFPPLFEVRENLSSSGKRKINYFQSHAG